MAEQTRVQWVYSSRDNQELADRYGLWAKDYEADLKRDFGWIGHQRAVETFARYVQKDARVLDAGAGTGLVGELLFKLGYEDVIATDLAPGMLEEARNKGVYKELHQMVLGQTLAFPTDSFGAVVCVGVLTVGHAPANSFDELVRITQPGGHIVFTIRPDVYEIDGFREKQQALESAGLWKLVEVSEKFQALPKGEPDIYHQIWVYQVGS